MNRRPPTGGPALRRWRQLRGLKQSHLAELLGVNQATVSRWEAGAQQPAGAQAAALARLLDAHLHPVKDAYLARMVASSTLPVHLICDATHRLFAASPARLAEWRRDADELLGVPLLPFAPADIAAAERRLGASGWDGLDAPRVLLATAGRRGGPYRVAAGLVLWERIALSDGSFARLVTTVARAAPFPDALRLDA